MSSFISYLLTSGIVLLALYLIYKWLLARETFCHFNRIYLLASYAVAFLIFPVAGMLKGISFGISAQNLPDVEIGPMTATLVAANGEEARPLLSNWVIYAIVAIIIAGMAVMTIQTLIVAAHIVGTIRRGERRRIGRYTLVLTENSRLAPFSWCGYIIMNRDDYNTGREMILSHEMNHQRYFHWIDLLVAQIAIILQWFNPAAWLMRDELRSVHEYEADMAVLRSGANAKEYQLLLIKKAVGAKFPALANCLNHSKLKKRITMMLKTKSSPWARMRAFVALPAIALAAAVINPQAVASALTPSYSDKVTENSSEQNSNAASKSESEPKIFVDGTEQQGIDLNTIDPQTIKSIEVDRAANTVSINTKSDAPSSKSSEKLAECKVVAVASSEKTAQPEADNRVFSAVQEMPQFPGGEPEMMKFIMTHLVYPEEAIKNNIQGRVVLQFVVTATGAIGETKIVRSVDPILDQAAIDVVKSLPAFIPGKIDGEPVSVWYTIPVSFRLTDDNKEKDK